MFHVGDVFKNSTIVFLYYLHILKIPDDTNIK